MPGRPQPPRANALRHADFRTTLFGEANQTLAQKSFAERRKATPVNRCLGKTLKESRGPEIFSGALQHAYSRQLHLASQGYDRRVVDSFQSAFD